MSNVMFDAPTPVTVKRYDLYKVALAKMGILTPAFYAVGVTPDGKVLPDKSCLEPTNDPAWGSPVNGKLCGFEPEIVALLRERKIPPYDS